MHTRRERNDGNEPTVLDNYCRQRLSTNNCTGSRGGARSRSHRWMAPKPLERFWRENLHPSDGLRVVMATSTTTGACSASLKYQLLLIFQWGHHDQIFGRYVSAANSTYSPAVDLNYPPVGLTGPLAVSSGRRSSWVKLQCQTSIPTWLLCRKVNTPSTRTRTIEVEVLARISSMLLMPYQ